MGRNPQNTYIKRLSIEKKKLPVGRKQTNIDVNSKMN
jgi:hypothetical protein